jgi:hypothetical protein
MRFTVVTALAIALLAHCGPAARPPSKTKDSGLVPGSPKADVVYRNTDYGFCLWLPKSWDGYSIVLQTWKGSDNTRLGEKTVMQGPLIAIRDPRWTAEDPHQDIPVMVFTHAQWQLVQHETLAVSAAPFPPSELGQNSKYVFGLPPRYNYAFPAGYKAVENILKEGAFHAPCPAEKE